jgi:Zn-dependent peptidase ImmA (M78 family)
MPMKVSIDPAVEPRAAQDSNIEREANLFAMALLMPEKWVRADVKKMGGVDIADGAEIEKLAKKYKVDATLMTMRIAQLYFGAKL